MALGPYLPSNDDINSVARMPLNFTRGGKGVGLKVLSVFREGVLSAK